MPQRPYWSGQIRIALVYLPVHVYTATRSTARVALHEIYKPTGERIHHKNVTEDGLAVEPEDIIKGYEVAKNRYVLLSDRELEKVKLPSSEVLELKEFIRTGDLPFTYYKQPYFILPDGKEAEEIYGVIRDALKETGKTGIGQIAARGKEELCAIFPSGNGLMLERLRYPAELKDPQAFFADIPHTKSRAEYVELAQELIQKNTASPEDLEDFHDRYKEALLELIEAKQEKRPVRPVAEEPKPSKVVDLMDALRHSLKHTEKAPRKAAAASVRKKSSSVKHRRKA